MNCLKKLKKLFLNWGRSEMKIRKGKLIDLHQIYELLNETPELLGGTEGFSYDKTWIKSALTDKEREFFLIAEENNMIVGILSAELWKDKRYSFLIDIVVKPKWRKKGIASALLREYEKYCVKIKIKRFNGLVLVTNKRMQNFLEKRNFKRGDIFYYYEKRLR